MIKVSRKEISFSGYKHEVATEIVLLLHTVLEDLFTADEINDLVMLARFGFDDGGRATPEKLEAVLALTNELRRIRDSVGTEAEGGEDDDEVQRNADPDF